MNKSENDWFWKNAEKQEGESLTQNYMDHLFASKLRNMHFSTTIRKIIPRKSESSWMLGLVVGNSYPIKALRGHGV